MPVRWSGNIANGSPIGDSMPALIAIETLGFGLRQGESRYVNWRWKTSTSTT